MSTHRVLYVGMDVDKNKIAMAVLADEQWSVSREHIVTHREVDIRRFFEKLKGECEVVMACYEAGSCGFELYRMLTAVGVACMVAAPSSLPKKRGERVKTDRRDAVSLAKGMRNGDLSGVHVPTRQDERVRDYLRLYEDHKDSLKRAKQRVLQFCLRRGLRWQGATNWTDAHMKWLRSVELEDELDREILNSYLAEVVEYSDKCRCIAERVEQLAAAPQYAERVAQLKGFKGVETLIALSLVVEIGDFRRFTCAEHFMAFLGLVPSEHSSGARRRQGGITKAGNTHLRKLLTEAAWHYRSYHPGSKRLTRRRQGLSAEVVTYANRAGRRLNRKYLTLVHRGKSAQVAATAVARELAGFLWGAMVGATA